MLKNLLFTILVIHANLESRSRIHCDKEYANHLDPSYDDEGTLSSQSRNKGDGLDASKLWTLFNDYLNENSSLNEGSMFNFIETCLKNKHRLNFVHDEIAQFDQDTIGLVTFKNYFTNVYGRELYEKLDDHLSTQLDISGSDDEMDLIYRFEHNRWKFISSNKDTMDHMDFYKFVFPNEFDDVNSNDALFVFRLYDLNGDGQWTFDEYIKAIDLHSGHLLINDFKYIVDKGKHGFTRSIDLDGNKLIDLKEFKNWNMPSLQQNINADLKRIYAACDADRDGHLTQSEVKQNFEFFQVFEFTNYGDDYRTHQANNHNEL